LFKAITTGTPSPKTLEAMKRSPAPIRSRADRFRVVAFEAPPADGGQPSSRYRTFTLWIIPNSAYRRGVRVEVVTPADEPITSTELP